MTRYLKKRLVIGLLVVLAVGSLRAAEPAAPSAEQRLREELRRKSQEAATATASLTAAQAAATAAADQNKTLATRLDALTKQAAADKGAADKAATGLNTQVAELKEANAKLTEALEKAKADGETAVAATRTADEKGVALAAENLALQRRVADREAKNLALYLVANEILSRYEDFSLGRALAAREPFVGKTRTRLENLMQDYEDKILDQRATP